MSEHPVGCATVGSERGPQGTGGLLREATRHLGEFVLTECPRVGESTAQTLRRLAERVGREKAEIVGMMLYGSVSARVEIERGLAEAFGAPVWPLTWVEGASCDGAALAGVQVHAVRGWPVMRVRMGDRVVASVCEDGGARHCFLGGLGAGFPGLRAPEQTQRMFVELETALDLAGFQLADVVRTWFYNDDILAWYGDFNRVRTALYSTVKWRTGSLPASTAVAGKNPAGAALAVAAWAVQPVAPGARALEVGSPLQCPAPAYGSSFSRAMEVDSGGWRRLSVSGTASIHPGGQTAWVGDARRQVDLSLEVVEAILQARGMGFGDVTRAVAYFKEPQFAPYFYSWLAERKLEGMPVVPVHCDICRDDLLFEIELDARVEAA